MSSAGAQSYEQLESVIAAWARLEEHIRAIAVVGSRARANRAPDQWSDLDLIVFTTEPDRLAADKAWLQSFGELWLAVPSRTGRGDPEWDALYAGGLKADFVIVSIGEGQRPLGQLLESSPYRFVFAMGVRALLDKNDPDRAIPLPAFAPDPPQEPDVAVLAGHAARFLLDASRAARFVARGDLWRAKALCDHSLKQQLLTMLEWHALATGTAPQEIWPEGRTLNEWADPAALRELPETFACFERADLARALLATIALYQRLARETATARGFALAETHDRQIEGWIRATLDVNA